MKKIRAILLLSLSAIVLISSLYAAKDKSQLKNKRTKENYVNAVVRGTGLMPWQKQGLSKDEVEFRQAIENRKSTMIKKAIKITHPVFISTEEIELARRNIEKIDWAREWFNKRKRVYFRNKTTCRLA